MDKLDLTKAYKSYYTAGLAVELVNIEDAQFLSITGQGDPDGPAFSEDVEALYTIGYGIKFLNKQIGQDFVVSKLEGYWWVEDTTVDPLTVPRSQWHYELVIRIPDTVTHQQFAQAVTTAEKKKNNHRLRAVDIKHMEGGRAIQILHVGPFSEEPASLKKMETYIQSHHLQFKGRHHEIYLSDFRKTAPEKLKTILRHAVA
ncbi:MAG: GyrI-like domain-containing protein [Chitinophaga sp.]|uniref:GyrI-like domain-containing protein n=1 Tax=Chitinophaga sp. TaxID=1869181 RepID=UPI0025C5C982|nr:GyrI-like domain-containing protein [Chitinophaga sp.]MBV8255117.1 GyrI-like domain-containing protein [Chitinophaga sp.]